MTAVVVASSSVDWIRSGLDPKTVEEGQAESAARLAHMSPRGKLGLPPLLEERRWQIGMIDQLFSQQAVYERLLLFQLTTKEFEKGTAGDSGIIVPDATLSREAKEAPRAVIVSAGLNAMDYLESHGMGLGHIVTICREAPYGIRVAVVGGKYYSLIIVDAGDVCASEDLAEEFQAGRAKVVSDGGEHKLTNAKGEAWSSVGMYEDRKDKPVIVKRRKKSSKKTGGRVKTTRATQKAPKAPRVRPGY